MKDNNGKCSRTLNIITQNFAVALGSTLSETLKIPPIIVSLDHDSCLG